MNEPGFAGDESGRENRDAEMRDNESERAGDSPPVESLRKVSSAELLQGAREVLIQHDDKTYRLRVTRNGKLILVK